MDYHRNFSNPMAARLFRWKHKPKFPENRRLDPRSDRYCRHTHHIARVGDRVGPRFVKNKKGGQTGCPFIHNTRKEISNDLHYHYSSNSTVLAWLLTIKPTT